MTQQPDREPTIRAQLTWGGIRISIGGPTWADAGLAGNPPPGPLTCGYAVKSQMAAVARCADLRLCVSLPSAWRTVQQTPDALRGWRYQVRESSTTAIALWVEVARLQATCSGPMYLVGSLSSWPRSHLLPGGMCLVHRQQ